jgi:hypothetical protein
MRETGLSHTVSWRIDLGSTAVNGMVRRYFAAFLALGRCGLHMREIACLFGMQLAARLVL